MATSTRRTASDNSTATKRIRPTGEPQPTTPPARRKKAAEAEASTPVRRTKRAVPPEESTPARRTKRAVQEVEKPVRRTRRTAEVEDEVASKPVRKKKTVVEEAVTEIFNPLADIADRLDGIERDYSLSGSSLSVEEERATSGLLSVDVVLSMGMLPGWYTFFGPEQSCKSTLASTVMTAALNSAVPIISYWDYEGCQRLSSKINTNYGELTFSEMLNKMGVSLEGHEEKTFIPVEGVEVETLSGMVNVDFAYYCGVRPITEVTTDKGNCLGGYAHPVLTMDNDGNLVYKKLEELHVGDIVVTRPGLVYNASVD